MKMFKTWSKYQLILITICVICIKRTVDTSDCADEFSWHCDTGDQCIDIVDRCDGTENCKDGSDETIKNCIEKKPNCNRYSFRCTYGACIPHDLTCNGQKDCADGSDELPALCKKDEWAKWLQGDCANLQMKCRTSGECISQDDLCDGQPACKDASDESLEVCTTYYCPALSFRCGYGGCVNGDAACNGKAECYDVSDESSVMCNTSVLITQPSTMTPSPPTLTSPTLTLPTPTTAMQPISPAQSCRVPADNYLLIVKNAITDTSIILGSYVPANQPVTFSCYPGYVLKGINNTICKGNGAWKQNLPGCYFYCSDKHPRSGFSTKVTFELDGDVSYKDFFEPGTVAKVTCSYFYKRGRYFKEKLICKNHGWDTAKESCNMRCGEPSDPVTKFSKGGVNTNITEVPWHVGIYNKSGDSYENICGGTLISPRIVVSAAHCFFEAQPTKIDLSTYSIAAGKYYRDYDREELGISAIEKRNIINVWVDEDYNGAENGFYRDISIITLDRYMIFSDTIRPVCLYLPDEANQYIFSDVNGVISAWGQIGVRGKESTLQTLHMATVSHRQCNATLAEKSFITLKGDKFCLASYGAEAFACKGDSGSGYVVRMPDNTFALWGVVSFSPTRTQDCSRDQLLVMTNALVYKNELQNAKKQDIENDIYYDSLK